MDMSITGYARVSTEDQDLSSQIQALQAAGCAPIYQEHATGVSMERPEWKACNRGLGRGDTLVVVSIDRLGRSLSDLVGTLENLESRGIQFRSLREGIDTSTPLGRMFFQIAASFAEYERVLISERTKAGLRVARERGSQIGRPPALTAEQKAIARRLRASGQSVSSIARVLGVSRATVRRASTS